MANDDLEVLKSGLPRFGIMEQYESASGMRWVQTDKVPILDKNGVPTGLVGFAQDITERKKAEEVLRESEESFRSLIDSIDDLVFVLGFDGIFKNYHQPSHKGDLYIPPEKFVGKHFMDVLPLQVAELCQASVKRIEQSGEIQEFEYFLETNGETSWYNARLSPMKDQSGRKTSITAVVRNISELKKSEQNLREKQNKIEAMNEKLRILGSLTRHDVGNKLMAAKSNLYLLKKRIGNNPDLIKYLDSIDFALASSDEIFEFSRLYERIGAEKPSNEDICECFNQAAALKPNLGGVKVVNECHGLIVVADLLLKQLFYNFIDNSLKHGEKVTQIKLHFTEDENEVKLFYEDDGVGVPDVNKSKLFDVGFSTGKGSGLGLYLVKKMMDVYGWTITEEGQPGKGAKFTITIPRLSNYKKNHQNLKGIFENGQ